MPKGKYLTGADIKIIAVIPAPPGVELRGQREVMAWAVDSSGVGWPMIWSESSGQLRIYEVDSH